MIQVCPYCGYSLECQLNDGLTSCSHCNRIIETSDSNVLLAAAWQVRKEKCSLEKLKWQGLDNDFAILVYTFVCEYGYTHEEFFKLLKKLKISK